MWRQLRQGLENFRLGNPYQHAGFHISHFTIANLYQPEEQLQALLKISATDLQTFVDSVFKRAHVEGLVHGNVRKEQAIELLSAVEASLKSPGDLNADERLGSRCLLPPLGSFCYQTEVQDPEQLNSSTSILYYFGDDCDQAIRTRASLLAQLAQEQCFDQLRTKEQLGYIVQSGGRNSVRFAGFNVIVQSEKDAEYIDERVEAWLTTFGTWLADMAHDEFAKQRQSLVNRKREDFKNFSQECVSSFPCTWSNRMQNKLVLGTYSKRLSGLCKK